MDGSAALEAQGKCKCFNVGRASYDAHQMCLFLGCVCVGVCVGVGGWVGGWVCTRARVLILVAYLRHQLASGSSVKEQATGPQGWQRRWWALTSTPRPIPQDEIRSQCPAPPSAPGLARASQSPGHQPDLFCLGLIRGLGWHIRESRSWAARRALAVSRACALCTCAHTRTGRALISTGVGACLLCSMLQHAAGQ